MQIIDGTKIAEKIKNKLKEKIAADNIQPNLAVILVGEDEASKMYVNLKEKACKNAGIGIHTYLLEQNSTKEQIKEAIQFLNSDKEIDAVIVQLPLPNRDWDKEITEVIDPKKDVDGFHPNNIELLLKGKPYIIPGLTEGIMILIKSVNKPIENKICTIISNNKIFSIPLKYLLEQSGVKVNILSADDIFNNDILKKSDILIAAIGKPNFIKKEMVKPGAIIIDVGISRINNKVVGDVDFKEVNKIKDGFITPVPGGVGPMTVAMLLKNTYDIAKKNKDINIK